MKVKKLFPVLAMILSYVLISSCQKNEPAYSCDPEINEIVTKNLDNIQQMSRTDIIEMEPEMTIACYRAFTKEQRVKFWQDKLQEVMTLGWNEQETAHLQVLTDYVNENTEIFEDNFSENEKLYDDFELFFYKWNEYAEQTLGWSSELTWSIIASPYTLTDMNGNLKVVSESITNVVKRATECNCNVKRDKCAGPGGLCSQSSCLIRPTGCGFLMQEFCDGMC